MVSCVAGCYDLLLLWVIYYLSLRVRRVGVFVMVHGVAFAWVRVLLGVVMVVSLFGLIFVVDCFCVCLLVWVA